MIELHLAPRELKIVELVRRDLSIKEMARESGLSPRTIEKYIASVADKLSAMPGRGQQRIRRHFAARPAPPDGGSVITT